MKRVSGRNPAIYLVLGTFLILLPCCSSKQMLTVQEAELDSGEPVYSVVDIYCDTLQLIGRDIAGYESGVYRDSVITGLLPGGSVRSIPIDSVSLVEVRRHNSTTTWLFLGGVALVPVILFTVEAGNWLDWW